MHTRQHIIDSASSCYYTLSNGSRIAICEIPHPGGFSRATEIRIRIAGDLRPLRGHGSSDAGIVARGWMSRTGPRSSIGRAIDALILSAAVPASVLDACAVQDAIDAERGRTEIASEDATRGRILASMGSAVCVIGGAR
jgi:hypothetical protein